MLGGGGGGGGNQKHIGAIMSIKDRSGAMGSNIERSIKEDLESAGSIKSDQDRSGAMGFPENFDRQVLRALTYRISNFGHFLIPNR